MPEVPTIGDKIRRYREQFQISQNELSNSTGISEDRLISVEGGASLPNGDEILILSDYFKCDYKFFITNEKINPFEETEILFRKHGTELSKTDRWAIQEFIFLCETKQAYLEQLKKGTSLTFRSKIIGTYFKSHGEQAASDLRKHLKIPHDQIPRDIFTIFESIGVHIFRRQLENSNISGLFIRHPTAGRCVLVNYDDDPFRQRFTVTHEVGHSILDDTPVNISFTKYDKKDLQEIRANTFASRFLLPQECLRAIPETNIWDANKLKVWASRLHVSIKTLVFALKDIDAITEDQVQEFKALTLPSLNKGDSEDLPSLSPGSRERLFLLLKRGLSRSFVELAFEAFQKGLISFGRLAEGFLLSEEETRFLLTTYGYKDSYGL